MFYLQDKPKQNYAFIYVNTESINSVEDYFKRLIDELLNSEAVKELISKSDKAKSIIDRAVEKIKKLNVFGVGIELNHASQGKYSEEFFDLMKQLNPDEITIVMMIDEFPSTVENIFNKQSKEDAVQFLQLNRAIRQQSGTGILMMYTGSIGLPAIVNRLGIPESINDLNVLEIEPLSAYEGKQLAEKLLVSENIEFEADAIDFLLKKLDWLMPFFIQLAVQEIIDGYDNSPRKVDKEAITIAIEKIYNRRNKTHLDSYYNRLKDAFEEEDYNIAMQILNLIAKQTIVLADSLYVGVSKEEGKRRISSVLEALEYDGYIMRNNDSFSFYSPILQEWWNRYHRN
ncbi:MAG: hypothetical protein ACI85O_003117 [Saprospiraceae bacterium]|jgi:hypothetical protein